MADYTHYAAVTEEWTKFEKTWSPPTPPAGASVQQIRDLANAGAAKNFAAVLGRPEEALKTTDIEVTSFDGEAITVRLYVPKKSRSPLAVYITFHGGGYYLGSLETEDPWARQVALTTGLAVLNVNYRHTPEYVFPTPVHDAWAAFAWIQRSGFEYGLNPKNVYVGGVSVGATLALTVALRALESAPFHPVKGLMLTTPATVHPDHFPTHAVKNGFTSLQQNADAPFINVARLRHFTNLYQPEPTHPSYSPLLLGVEAFAKLCPTSFYIAGRDPLRDEGLLLEEKLQKAGVQTKLQIYRGLPHAFGSLPHLPSAATWRQNVQDDLKALVSGVFPALAPGK